MTINLTQHAITALETSLDANTQGEIPGMGPAWACPLFGQPDHDYLECPDCKAKFLSWHEAALVATGVA